MEASHFQRQHRPDESEGHMKFVLIVVTVMFAFVFAAHLSSAAPQSKGAGTLTGVVLGPDDKPVPHASITYQSSAGMAPHAAHADSHGHFVIKNLKADNYDLRASSKGVFSEWEKNVAVRSRGAKSVTLRLIYAKEVPKEYTKKNSNDQ